jgi:hypothetical protein
MTSELHANYSVGSDQLPMKEQRDMALACAVLSLGIAIALILSHFPANTRPIDQASAAVDVHRKLLAEAQATLKANEEALARDEQALRNVRAAVAPRSP